jgi:hypothetical protein
MREKQLTTAETNDNKQFVSARFENSPHPSKLPNLNGNGTKESRANTLRESLKQV